MVGSSSAQLENDEALFVNCLTLQEGYASTVPTVDVWLEVDTDENNLFDYYVPDFFDQEFYEPVDSDGLSDLYNAPT